MVDPNILRDIQERLMECMTDLYENGRDDEDAQNLAHRIVHIYDDIEFEMVLRGEPVA